MNKTSPAGQVPPNIHHSSEHKATAVKAFSSASATTLSRVMRALRWGTNREYSVCRVVLIEVLLFAGKSSCSPLRFVALASDQSSSRVYALIDG